MEQVSLKTLLEVGCHFGHKADRWHPKATAFIYQERDGIHVIDLAKTKLGLEKAGEFITKTAQNGGSVLFVGTKRQASAIIKEEVEAVGANYISKRWIGGFLTNWEQVHKNLEKIRRLTEEEKNNAWKIYPKHERVKLSRYLKKLLEFYGGVVTLTDRPQAIVIVDINREKVAVNEAQATNVPVVAVVDTNADPSSIDYVIPSNDDAVGAIKYIIHYLAEAFREGKEAQEKELIKEQKKAEKQVDKVEKVEDKKTEKPKKKTMRKKKAEEKVKA